MATRSNHVSLIVKGPMKSARRAAQRHGLSMRDCVDTSMAQGKPSPTPSLQCYVPCSPSTNRKVVDWYADNVQNPKPGRGHPAGTLLYHGGLCPTDFGRRRKRRRKRR